MSIPRSDILEKLTRREREQLEREKLIITKAEELFCKHGFEKKVSMDDLAKESEFTKRTIYRYFTCKEDLFFAVALRGNQRLYDMIKKIVATRVILGLRKSVCITMLTMNSSANIHVYFNL